MRRSWLPLLLFTVSAACLLVASEGESQPQPRPTSSIALYNVLIQESLRIADDDDPLLRAGGTSRVADQFAQAITQAAERGDQAEVLRLTKLLSQLLQRGIQDNVQQLDPAQLDASRLPVWKALAHRPDELRQMLQQQLVHVAKPAVEPGSKPSKEDKEAEKYFKELERWLKKEMDKGKGKGKGKKGRDDDDWPKGKDKDKKGKKEAGDDDHKEKEKKGKKDQASLGQLFPEQGTALNQERRLPRQDERASAPALLPRLGRRRRRL